MGNIVQIWEILRHRTTVAVELAQNNVLEDLDTCFPSSHISADTSPQEIVLLSTVIIVTLRKKVG